MVEASVNQASCHNRANRTIGLLRVQQGNIIHRFNCAVPFFWRQQLGTLAAMSRCPLSGT
eukprot:674390-Pelagomonas_calceolata.AAC.1